MVRVLMINYEYPPLGGGTAICNYYLLKEFKKLNIVVDLLTSSPAEFQTEKINKNINIIRIDIGKNKQNLHHQSYLDLIRFFWKSTFWALEHRHNYDLVHAYSGMPGSLTAWLLRKPFLVSLGGADEPDYEPRHQLFWKFFKPLVGFIYRRAHSLDTNSAYLKNLVLKAWPGLKIKVIYNGVNTNEFYPSKKRVKQQIILCTSRFGQRKGIEYLIKAIYLVPKARLLLVGSGALELKYKRLVKKLHLTKRVNFLGIIMHQRLATIYRQAKLFVLPSLSESRSNALLEALASGLPAVATNVGGNPELVNPENGILVPPADSDALAKAIATALNKKWPEIKINTGRSWSASAKDYYQTYLKIKS